MPAPRAVILASTSRYRAELLRRILSSFEQVAPNIDETIEAESVGERAKRLAMAKARAVATNHPEAIVIGSDQVASLDGAILHKPGDHDTAHRQLMASSGHTVMFHTAVCVFDGTSEATVVDTTRVVFRTLDDATVDRYLAAEEPWDCAGSFKCEGLGITLFERIENTDPTALIGLPLIATARLLRGRNMRMP